MNRMLASKDARARQRRWQSGGTVTGVIVGLIVGLTVAVWVAMTILKTPLPFVDKISKQSQPAGELGDPNKTMPGGARERRERMSEDEPASPTVEAIVPPASAKSAKVTKDDVPPAIAAPAASSANEKTRQDKLPPSSSATTQPSSSAPATTANTTPAATASPTAASTPATAPSTAPQPEGFTYYLQAGAFREINDAEGTKAKLALMGVAATIAERKSELGTLYRVRVGPFAEIEAMNRARLRLSDNGVDAAVVKVPK